ncbi:NIPSNAP family protein [Flavobacterium gawalongense]|uniref:NIPSNAP family containing protein n=1 Tax=Flavobacterium gawalongense TaxID=2594432 RepID=A0A553BS48_9FLAO|nr:NIPSNAP family protein [Flavobacterium gawalongense]TRX03164.1 NIPSNAP family containing protein [Flavobacterium gawalongense]TRX09826.1 NIPSNAP family containing protein [Flavobacterium gawalongense]TRX11055.1 NIPSNAP family containing protein [Flavobacterium gawalongense]TRX11982.1 NIPSNAP family containing protein [Flavobacterium gawalongense]TRX29828.1 NIPSNAP family containing protein [Flavobacterium gawalongense]
MKLKKLLFLILIIFTITSFKTTPANAMETKPVTKSREFYQLKTYILKTKQQEQITDKYLKEAYLPGLKKLGIKNIGVFKPKPNATDTLKKIMVLIPFLSMEQFLGLDEKLAKDKTYLATGAEYLDATYKQPPYMRIESVLLKAFSDHPILTKPALNSARANRVYELRSYESATEAIYKNKVDMFNGGGEIKLFDKLGFNAVFYSEVISGAKMPNLMYMTTFADQASRDAHWKSFGEAPEWKEMSGMEKYKNNVSHIDITFMYPTDYSDY